jgi:hypothetical protein
MGGVLPLPDFVPGGATKTIPEKNGETIRAWVKLGFVFSVMVSRVGSGLEIRDF